MRIETSTEIVDNFSHDGSGAISDNGPFSMTEEAVFTPTPAGQLVNRGQTEVKLAVPEPSTWAKCCLASRRLPTPGFARPDWQARSPESQHRHLESRLRAAFFRARFPRLETQQPRAGGPSIATLGEGSTDRLPL